MGNRDCPSQKQRQATGLRRGLRGSSPAPRRALPTSLQGVFPDVNHSRAGSAQVPPGFGQDPEVPGQSHLRTREHPPCRGLGGLPRPRLLPGALLLTAQARPFPRQREGGPDQVPHLFPGAGGTVREGLWPEQLGRAGELLFGPGGRSALQAQRPLLRTWPWEGGRCCQSRRPRATRDPPMKT